jgi:signal transduction histidine kinase
VLAELDQARLRQLIEAGRALVSRLDLEGVLETVLAAAREVTGARYAALGVPDDTRSELDRFLTLGLDEKTRAEIGDLRGEGVLGGLIKRREEPRGLLEVPILVRGEAWGNLYLAEKQGGGKFGGGDEAAVRVLADWAAVAVENARLYEGLARRRNEVEQQRDQAERSAQALAVMTDIARSVGGETDIDRILELIVDRGRALVQARALLILLEEGQQLVVAATAGELDSGLLGTRVGATATGPGRVLRSGRAERLEKAGGEHEVGVPGITAEAAILVPLTFRGASSGVLIALDRMADGPGFGLDDERLLRSFAASAATAVATAKSVEAERLRHSLEAAEQERKRWARELHDETLQAFGGLRMLHSTALRGDADAVRLREALREGIELIDVEIDNLSALIAELRPAALDEIGLVPALRTLAERKSREGGLSIDILARVKEGQLRLPPETESLLYRLVQEALNNVVKHAGASRAEAVLEREDGVVSLTVSDDGRGFDAAAANGGFGLTGMRERVELAGGELTIETVPGSGTTVSATIPVRPHEGGPHRSSRP